MSHTALAGAPTEGEKLRFLEAVTVPADSVAGPDLWAVLPLAALVSLAASLVFRYFDRPRPLLEFEMKFTLDTGMPKDPSGRRTIPLDLINFGDGTAFDVALYGSNADVATKASSLHPDDMAAWTHRLAAIGPGARIRVFVVCPPDTELKDSDVRVVISYSKAPKRLWPRTVHRVRITDIPTELPYPAGILDHGSLPKWPRTRKRLELNSPRAQLRRYQVQKGQTHEADSSGAHEPTP
jgi:hypothetical protein